MPRMGYYAGAGGYFVGVFTTASINGSRKAGTPLASCTVKIRSVMVIASSTRTALESSNAATALLFPGSAVTSRPVSYTHLTLPTISSV